MDSHYFQEKGKIAEEFISRLCSNAFQYDFCFKNPYVDGRELCDELVVLQNKAIIWQIKNIKETDGEIKEKEIEKAIRQCIGAKRTMTIGNKIILTNVNNEKKTIDCKKITEYFLVVAVEDGLPSMHSFFEENGGNIIHIFFSPFTRFALKYLNTVPDLVDYLKKKELFLKDKSMVINGGEEEFLAHFLSNARSFGELEKKGISTILFDGNDAAKKFEESDGVKIRLEEEKKYCSMTDRLIKKRRESISAYKDIFIPQETKDLIISLFLNMNALEKRIFGKLYFECGIKAHKLQELYRGRDGILSYRDYYASKNVLFIFCFAGDTKEEDKELRRTILKFAAYGAIKKSTAPFDYIVGVGTEMDIVKNPTQSFEWLFIDYSNKEMVMGLIDKEFPDLDYFLNGFGILANPKIHHINENEYEKSELLIHLDVDLP
jgi:hypothetical protein